MTRRSWLRISLFAFLVCDLVLLGALLSRRTSPPQAGFVTLNETLTGYSAVGQAGEFVIGQELTIHSPGLSGRVRVVRISRLSDASLEVSPEFWAATGLDGAPARWMNFTTLHDPN